MTKPFNPLLDKRRTSRNSVTMTAAEDEITASSPPLSPVSGRPMVKAYCRDVPVYVDPQNRLVLPIKA